MLTPTLSSVLPRPTDRSAALLRDGALMVGAGLLLTASAKIQIPGPIPFTMQPWAVLLIGATLGSRLGTLTVLLYLLQGLAGLPVFANPGAGPLYFLGPTAGYLFGFLPAAWLVGRLSEHGWDRRFTLAASAFCLGQLVILSCGAAWLALHVGLVPALVDGVTRFLIGDVVKVLLAAWALPFAWRIVERRHGS